MKDEVLEIKKKNALDAFKEAGEEGKKLLVDLLGKEHFNLNIMERVKTLLDACAIVKPSAEVSALMSYSGKDEEMIAASNFAKASHIRKVLNEGWEPDWTNSNEYKYYPWFDMSSGSGLSFGGCGGASTYALVGSRLCFKSRELAKYAGTQFADIYKAFYNL